MSGRKYSPRDGPKTDGSASESNERHDRQGDRPRRIDKASRGSHAHEYQQAEPEQRRWRRGPPDEQGDSCDLLAKSDAVSSGHGAVLGEAATLLDLGDTLLYARVSLRRSGRTPIWERRSLNLPRRSTVG